MGSQFGNCGYGQSRRFRRGAGRPASMGPRSDNRGYGSGPHIMIVAETRLQWVHGPITVVMIIGTALSTRSRMLQWVHGPITVVMIVVPGLPPRRCDASMGPRSDNRGYARVNLAREPEKGQASIG